MYCHEEKVVSEFCLGCMKERVGGGGQVFLKHTYRAEGCRAFWQRDHLTQGGWCWGQCWGGGGVSRQRREAGERKTDPPGRLGWRGARTYFLSWTTRPFQPSPPLSSPNLSSKPPQDPGNLPTNLLPSLPRHLAPPQIDSVCELGGRGVWAHWLHRIHRGE